MILVSPFISIRAAARHIGGRLVAFLFSNVFQNQRRRDVGGAVAPSSACVSRCYTWMIVSVVNVALVCHVGQNPLHDKPFMDIQKVVPNHSFQP